ncbi:MAG TPA: hypothetical protein VN807_02825 [Candidatus Sulfotelmatobacter sp.]|nr:hypothetical protein [Candidatus Sulfotelmatobacter sp.]
MFDNLVSARYLTARQEHSLALAAGMVRRGKDDEPGRDVPRLRRTRASQLIASGFDVLTILDAFSMYVRGGNPVAILISLPSVANLTI